METCVPPRLASSLMYAQLIVYSIRRKYPMAQTDAPVPFLKIKVAGSCVVVREGEELVNAKTNFEFTVTEDDVAGVILASKDSIAQVVEAISPKLVKLMVEFESKRPKKVNPFDSLFGS